MMLDKISIKDDQGTKENCRREVEWFAGMMEKKLRANDHKGGWHNCKNDYLFKRIREEITELADAILYEDGDVIDEAVDVANFAMMIADNFRRRQDKGIMRSELRSEWKEVKIKGDVVRLYLPKRLSWIAKDSDGICFAYQYRPSKDKDVPGLWVYSEQENIEVPVKLGKIKKFESVEWGRSLRKLR